MKTIRRAWPWLASWILPGALRTRLLNWLSRGLRRQLWNEITDDFLELLLRAMDLWFLLSRDYRRNIRGFRGVYVFRTEDEVVAATAVFEDGDMSVEPEAREKYDCRVTFQDAKALWSFLLAEDQDILDSILANTVEIDGNLNHIYRFGFLARDLTRRFDPLRLAAA